MEMQLEDKILNSLKKTTDLKNIDKSHEIAFLLYQLYFKGYNDLFSFLKKVNNQDLVLISLNIIKSSFQENEVKGCFNLLDYSNKQNAFLELLKESNPHLYLLKDLLNEENKDFLFYHSLVYNNRNLINDFVKYYNPENDNFKSLEMVLRRSKYEELEYLIKKYSIDNEQLLQASIESRNLAFVLKNFESYDNDFKEKIILSLDDFILAHDLKSTFQKCNQLSFVGSDLLYKLINVLNKNEFEKILNKSNFKEIEKVVKKIESNFDKVIHFQLANKMDSYNLLLEFYNNFTLKEKLNNNLKTELEKSNTKSKRKI